MILFLDLETYGHVSISHGTYVYAENAEIMVFAYAVDDGPVQVWDLTETEETPPDLATALLNADRIVAHNSMFDRTVLRLALNTRPLFRQVGDAIDRWYDTLVQGLTHSLPGGLAKLGSVMRLGEEHSKLDDGKNLIRLFCIPPAKHLKRGRATRDTHPKEWEQFLEYATHDILAMRELYKRVPKWNYQGAELSLWHLDQKINDRGFEVDMVLAQTAIETIAREQKRLKLLTQEMTGYDLEAGEGLASTSQRDKLLEYILKDYSIALEDLTKDTLERTLEDPELPPALRELLTVRLMVSTSSTSKYKRLINGVNTDHRLRGTLQFCGASRTGRWAGRLFQPQNLPRPNMKPAEIDTAIDAIKENAADLIYDNVMRVCANAIRGCIIAPPGKKLVVADLSNIEGRMAAWLAGEDWKLDKFRQYDIGKGADLYIVAYAKAFQVEERSIDKSTLDGGLKRQIGKVMELMLQYGGGVGAFLTGAATYNIDLEHMAKVALPTIPRDILKEAKDYYLYCVKQKLSTYGLPQDVFVACDALKRLWRQSHPAISSYWKELEAVVRDAIDTPGEWLPARRLQVRCDGSSWLRVQLPSGRFLCYPNPYTDEKGVISYRGMSQYTKSWGRVTTYGGKLFENITQAASRDVLVHGMLLAEEHGYETVLGVHDELITEAPDSPGFGVDTLITLMSDVPPWAKGLPLAAAGFEDYRYKKKD